MTLNLMTLGGLALGVGMMVDSSIIILEGICRYREENMPPKEAAIKGATELSMAVVASTLTTIAVFLPIVFTQGMASMFFKDFAFTVAFSLGASLLVSLTLVPMLASKMKSVEKQRKGFKFIEKMKNGTGSGLEKLNAAYARLLNICLKHRRITVSVVFAALIASFAAVPMVGMELMPAFDQGQIAVQLTMDKGMSLAETDEIMQEVEDIIADLGQEVKSNFVTIGSGAGGMMSAGGSAGSDSASCSLILADQDHRRPIAEIGEELRIKLSQIPGTDVSVDTGDISAMMGGGSALSYSLRGDDLDVLEQISLELKDMIIATPGTREVSTSLEGGRPEMQIKINRQKAAQYGLTTGQIATAARSALDGEIAGQYRHNGEEIDIKVMLPDYQTKTSQDIGQVLLATPMGLHIPLDEVAEISISQSPLAIERINNSRVVSISAQVLGRDLNSVAKEIQDKIDDWNLPQGYSLETGGNVQEMTDAFSDLFLALVLAIILVYFVMASLFESLVDPFVVMFSMPTTFIGVVWALALTGRTLNLSSFIGIIMLAGIVVNNGIVLVDCINQLREEGMEMRDAICKAGSIRLRPILMTALTTILAMLPIFLGFGEGNEMSAPMATALVGGLTASTVFTLVFVPVVYSIINDWRDNFHKRFAKKRTDSQKELVENENNN
ncbi:MAG: efflux RND transporter permease subunit, partial [Clostridiales bacterium]